MKLASCYCFLLLTFFAEINHGEIFTALVAMESLLKTEAEIIAFLQEHIQKEEEKIQKLHWYLHEYKKQYETTSSSGIQNYLKNPISAYLLVKRLSRDWQNVENIIYGNTGYIQNFNRRKKWLVFPEDSDLAGVAGSLIRLQITYDLETSSLARGEIPGTHTAAELSAGDCFELGQQAYHHGYDSNTVFWMEEALKRLENEPIKTAEKQDILGYLAYSHYLQGNVQLALTLTNEVLKIDPENPHAASNKTLFERILFHYDLKTQASGEVVIDPLDILEIPDSDDWKDYLKLCRGETLMSLAQQTQLHCYYSATHPFYILQPFKLEEASLSPEIVIHHDFVSDHEIDILKNLAKGQLERAEIGNEDIHENDAFDSYRTSKNAWLTKQDHIIVEKINQRMEDEIGLSLDTAENLQVFNYGIGGHYGPHYDCLIEDSVAVFGDEKGDRIATVLIYMSDVDAGGATVFPKVGVSLTPRKGSAALWYNLLKNGEADLLSEHAGCPVLAGIKWGANKWFHERGQEFRRPCGLNSHE